MMGRRDFRLGQQFMRPAKATTLSVAVTLALLGSAIAQQSETISFESRQKGQPVQITAAVTWPASPGPVPALVIHHGSGGIHESHEGRYVREDVEMGVAAVVIDSFGPRGVRSTVQDQSAVTSQDFNLDALAALKALGANPRIDRSRIGIVGFSKGGTSALMAAHERQIAAAGVPAGLRYALHVPFYPACTSQYYQPRTSGAPIRILSGAADTYVGVEPCQTYANALRAAGADIDVIVFPGAAHGFDGGTRAWSDPRGENYSQCVFQERADGSWVERKSGIMAIGANGKVIPDALKSALATCRTLGVSGGPNESAAKKSMEDLKGYIRRYLLKG
jgi:dienelactone hydrolase